MIMMRLRLKRSAATPPKGLKSATGRSAAAEASESHSGEAVDSVMYHRAAKLAAHVASTEAACPHQMTATVATQLRESALPSALQSFASFVCSMRFLSRVVRSLERKLWGNNMVKRRERTRPWMLC